VRNLLRYIETPEGRNKVVHALGKYVPLVCLAILLLLLVVKFKFF